MTLRNTLEQFPSYQLCRSKIEELDGRIAVFQQEKTKLQTEAANPKRIDGINEEIAALAELRGHIQALLDYMQSSKADISGSEREYEEIVRELMALKPETAETETDRKGLIERAKNLTARLQKALETLEGFDSPEGPADELQDLRRDTRTNVRVLLKNFFGEDESAAAEIEKQLELRPSETERRLAAFFYTQANPRAKKVEGVLDKFFASKEYKTFRAEFVAASRKDYKTGSAKIFAETEFAKLAAMKTPEERRKHADVILKVVDGYTLDTSSRSGYSVVLPYCVGSKKAEFLRAESGNECENIKTREFFLQIKFRLLRFGESELDYALPSYALWSLFRKGKLAALGIQDETFAQIVNYNSQGGYLNFAQWSESGNLYIKGDGTKSEVLKAAVLQEMQEVARELVPAVNVLSGYRRGLGEFAGPQQSQSSWLKEYRKCGLRVNTHTGAVESELPASEPVNQVGHVVYQFNKQDGEKERREFLVNKEMVAGVEHKGQPLDISRISGFRDVPEGYPLRPLLTEIYVRLENLNRKIVELKSHKHVTDQEKRTAKGYLDQLFAFGGELRDARRDLKAMTASLGKKERSWSWLSVGKKQLREQIANREETIRTLEQAIEAMANLLEPYGLNPQYYIQNAAQLERSSIDNNKRYIEEHCVVGLNEMLEPLIAEFNRLIDAYNDIYNHYADAFDKVSKSPLRRDSSSWDQSQKIEYFGSRFRKIA
ncbi:hypothetical protein HZC21_01560 [Candidatus Peregrinibacteria bacterium]|nr:hypothetical protein [Candidatus Peregrinibacteria bacterium]